MKDKPLTELLQEQEEQLRLWIDDNPDFTVAEWYVVDTLVTKLNVSIEKLKT